MMRPRSFSGRRSGVTLLELILALGLSTVVLAIIGMALNMYWRMFDQRRTSLEEARIARAVLRKVSDDLRSTIQFQPPDLSGLNIVSASMQGQLGNATAALGALSGAPGATPGTSANTAGQPTGGNQGNQNQTGGNQTGQNPANQAQPAGNNSNAQAAGTGNASGNGQGRNQGNAATGQTGSQVGSVSGGAGASGSDGANGGAAMDQGSSAGGAPHASSKLGLRGTMYELQIDISRLPRIDEYTALTDPNSPLEIVDIPSDVKTISYFAVGSEQEGAELQVGLKVGEEVQPIRGLFRRERSRALSSAGAPLSSDGISRDNSQLLAEQVTSIEFSYFDGLEWYSDWDSSSMGGLPKAIEIAIEVNMTPPDSTTALDAFSLSSSSTDTTETEPAIYKLVVSLPSDPPLELPTSNTGGSESMDDSMGGSLNAANAQNAAGMQPGMMNQGGMGMGAGALGGGQLGGGLGQGGPGQGGAGPGGNGQRRGGNGRNGGGNGGPGANGNNGGPNGGNNQGNNIGGRGQGGRGGQGFGGRGGQGQGQGQGFGGRGGGQGLGGGMGGRGGGGLGGGGFGGGRGGGMGGGLGGGGLGGGGFGGGQGLGGGGLGGGGLGGGQGLGGGLGGRR